MKSRSILCASVIMLASVHPVAAEVILQLPSDVELLTVNGQKPSGTTPLILSNGLNQIAFRYNTRYRQQTNSVRYQSDVLIIRFEEADQQLQLELPSINSAKSAKQFNDSPTLKLVNKQNQSVHFDQDRLVKNGLQIGRNFEQEIFQYNQGKHLASLTITAEQSTPQVSSPTMNNTVTPLAAAITPTTTIKQSSTPNTPTQAEISHMLDYWYQLADDTTKARFKAKISVQ